MHNNKYVLPSKRNVKGLTKLKGNCVSNMKFLQVCQRKLYLLISQNKKKQNRGTIQHNVFLDVYCFFPQKLISWLVALVSWDGLRRFELDLFSTLCMCMSALQDMVVKHVGWTFYTHILQHTNEVVLLRCCKSIHAVDSMASMTKA